MTPASPIFASPVPPAPLPAPVSKAICASVSELPPSPGVKFFILDAHLPIYILPRHAKLIDAFHRGLAKSPQLSSPLHTITTPVYLAQLIERYCRDPHPLPFAAATDAVTAVGPHGTLAELLAKIDELHGVPKEDMF